MKTLADVYRAVRYRPWLGLVYVFALVALGFVALQLWSWRHFRAAEHYLQEDQLDLALDHVTDCARFWHGSDTHLLSARIQRIRGDYKDAERHLAESIRLRHGTTESTEVEALLLRAETGSLNEVEPILWKCIQSNHSESSWMLDALSRVYLRSVRLGAALRCLDRWTEREPQLARAWHWRGWVHERLQHPEKAIPDYQHTLAVDPHRWGTRLRLTRLFLDRHDPRQARPHLVELLRDHAEESAVQIASAQCAELEGEVARAAEILDRLLATNPDDAEALACRGQLCLKNGELSPAEDLLKKALAKRPADVSNLYALSKCLKEQGKEEEASRIANLHKTAKDDAYRLAELWDREIERSPNNPDLLSEIGAILLRRNEREEGLTWLYRALDANPSHVETHKLLVRYYESRQELGKAQEHRRFLTNVSNTSL